MSTEAERYPSYRWIVLGLAWLVLTLLVWSWFLIPSLAFRLFPEFGLTHAQFTLILTAPFLIGIFTPLWGGALGDRFGIRLIVAVAALLASISGIARTFTPSFMGMFVLMSLFGIGYGVIMPNLPKLVGIWFPPRQAGLASGIYFSGLNIGAALGLLTGPLFGGWKPAFLTIGILMLAAAFLWALFARDVPQGVHIQMPPLVTGIKRGIKSKNVWLIALAQFLYLGAFVGFSGNFPSALENVHHVSPKTAGAIASLLTWGLVIGNFFLPMFSDRIGIRKPFVHFGAAVSALCLFFAWYFSPGGATGILIFIGGVIFGSIQPVLFAILVELPEIGPECMGGASGIVATLLNAGGFFVPLVVTSPLVAAGTLGAYTTGFLVTAMILGGIIILTLFLMETGAKATTGKK
ncbi:MAG: MFS transporter [Deltaproteobacteria bacterium]|nr:MFS transporter [Deltaproteobacteria bacterium]